MNRLARSMSLSLALALSGIIFFAVHGHPAKAQSIIHGDTFNSQVELFCNFFFASKCILFRLDSNGTTMEQFTIPRGRTFVFTDMECTLQTAAPGQIATCGLFDQGTACDSTGLCETNKIIIAQGGAPSGADKVAVIGLHLTTGIRLTFLPEIAFRSTASVAHANVITIQGYLIPTPAEAP